MIYFIGEIVVFIAIVYLACWVVDLLVYVFGD